MPAAARLAQRLRRSGKPEQGLLGSPLEVIEGDVGAHLWDLSSLDLERITRSVDMIIHAAADTSFAHRHRVHQTNVLGTAHLIDLARRCRRKPLIVYISTAANVGNTSHRCVSEEDGANLENEHFNDYTRSKALAEEMFRASGLPVLTLRPSIVLSAGMSDSAFAKSILWCVPLSRLFPCLPLDPAARVDVVDVAFVAEATIRLLKKARREHSCYHISAGEQNATTLGEVVDFVNRFYKRRSPLHLVPPRQWTRRHTREHIRSDLQRHVFSTLRHYLPFISMDVVYDDSRLRRELHGQPLSVQPLLHYLGDLLKLIKPKKALQEAQCP
jgi:nucleoside-diphosphate-sugar epimerase